MGRGVSHAVAWLLCVWLPLQVWAGLDARAWAVLVQAEPAVQAVSDAAESAHASTAPHGQRDAPSHASMPNGRHPSGPSPTGHASHANPMHAAPNVAACHDARQRPGACCEAGDWSCALCVSPGSLYAFSVGADPAQPVFLEPRIAGVPSLAPRPPFKPPRSALSPP